MKKAIFGATAAVALLVGGAASASTITQQSASDYTTAKGYEAAYLASISSGSVVTEDFESLALTPVGAGVTTISTAVGDFTQNTKGQIDDGLRILNAVTTPFSGRRDMTAESNREGQWLDSNDSKEVEWTLTFSGIVRSLGFFMTDVNDVSASMTATFANGGSETFEFAKAAGAAPNGEISYITAFFDSGVTSVKFNVNTSNDGWGIDNVTINAVPVPAAGFLLLGGLGALGAAARRKRKAA